MTGEISDISEYLDFTFYYCCWYNENASLGETKLGKYIGVSYISSSIMYNREITDNGTVVLRTTVFRVTSVEAKTDKNKARITTLYKAIQECLND